MTRLLRTVQVPPQGSPDDDGSLQLVCNQDRLLKIFRITGLAKVFVIHDTAEAALAAS